MKDMGKAYCVIRIEIFRDRSQQLIGLSQKTCINKFLERFRMDKCSTSPIPKNDLDWKQMENIPYAFVAGSLMYAQT